MRIKELVLASLSLVILSTGALAATEFYVAMNATTKKCEVTDKKPDGKASTMVGTKTFAAKADAEAAMKAEKTCK